jgi:Uma2 family endonuclease
MIADAEMTVAASQELTRDPRLLYRMTVDEYHRMIKSGVLEEGSPYELLDGHVVRKIRSAAGENPMTVNPEHATVVTLLGKIDAKLARLGCHIRIQQPITLPPRDEPEPDATIARGTVDDYVRRHPRATDVLCVIEVADASLRRDRGYKQQLYADSGIETYVIANLLDRVNEVYTEPMKGKGKYANIATLGAKQSLTLPTARGSGLTVPVRKLLR